MKIKPLIIVWLIAMFSCFGLSNQRNENVGQFKYSKTIEKERPQLNETTKALIAKYRRNPSKENLEALRKQVEKNYDEVIARKKAKLEELKRTAKHKRKIDEMKKIVKEVIKDKDKRIEQSMRRFTDPRLRPGMRNSNDAYLPVLGISKDVSIARTPVTNQEYATFVKATNSKAPKGWGKQAFPTDKATHPVVNITLENAQSYCKWLSDNDKSATYRLPTEEEWEYAAGHMPKDASFNNSKEGTSPVNAYAKTLSACGAIDMWGNCWEMVTLDNKKSVSLKGGSWKSSRMDCRTEYKKTLSSLTYADDISFRVVRVAK